MKTNNKETIFKEYLKNLMIKPFFLLDKKLHKVEPAEVSKKFQSLSITLFI